VVFENLEVSQQILEFDLRVQIDDKLVGFEKFATQKDLFKKVSEVQNIQNDSAFGSFVRLDQQNVYLNQTLVNPLIGTVRVFVWTDTRWLGLRHVPIEANTCFVPQGQFADTRRG